MLDIILEGMFIVFTDYSSSKLDDGICPLQDFEIRENCGVLVCGFHADYL